MVKINFKKQKGITLIALIITIIVLLILAGVTLNIVLNSGIINKSQTATSKYNEQATKEKLTLALTEYKFKQLAGETPAFNDIITNIGGEVTETTDTEWTIDLDGFVFTVNKKSQQITSIEPSNSTPLEAPEISTKTFTIAADTHSATIKVTAIAKNGGTLTVKIDNKTATLVGSEYTMEVDKNGNIEIEVTETVGNKTKTTTTTINVTGIVVPKYTVTLTNDSGITSVTGGGEVEKGQSVTISATVENGKVFGGWNVTNGNASDVADLTANPTTVTPTGNITISCSGATIMATPTAESGYVGCYADIDGNGTVDGIIYADILAEKPTSGSWGSIGVNTSYTISAADFGLTENNVKEYVLSATPVINSKFDSTARYIVSLASNTSGTKDRFFVMGLEDIKNGTDITFSWYENAYGSVQYDTSRGFGTGKTNTETMIDIFYERNGKTKYAEQGNKDLWKYIDTQVSQGWFVPSRDEWVAFGKAFNISKTSTASTYYRNFGLSGSYWSSSNEDKTHIWYASFYDGYIGSNQSNNENICVRLSRTF